MVFSGLTNSCRRERDYTTSAVVPSKYRPLIERGKPLANQTSRSEFPAKRQAGDTNIDLWLDGSIYPQNPMTGAVPTFCDMRSLLCYVGDGESGLLGYTKALQNNHRNCFRCADLIDLLSHTEKLKQIAVAELTHERDALIASNQFLQHQYELHVAELQTEAHNVSLQYKENIRRLQVDVVDKQQHHIAEAAAEMESMVKCGAEEVDRLHSNYKSAIADLILALLTVKTDLARSELKCNRISQSAFSRGKRDLCDLSQTGGRAKRQKAVMRKIVQPATVSAVQNANFEEGTQKRLCGPPTKQSKTGAVLASILSQREAGALMENSKFMKVACEITNGHLQKMGEIVKPRHVLGGMDRSGISHKGYTRLFKIMKEDLCFVDKNLNLKSMPNPFQVSLLRTEMNGNLKKYIGDYYHINNSWQIPAKAGEDSRNRTPTHLHLDHENNTLFVDVEMVQRSMLKLYNITLEELDNGPLLFVLKMDEAEIVKQEKQA